MPDVVAPTGHVDTFCADHLPPPELWPVRDWTGIPELAYPERLNCAAELLDKMVESGAGDRLVFRFPGGTWTYRHLLETSNRIAHVLVDELGLVSGNRVLLRGRTIRCLQRAGSRFSRRVVSWCARCRCSENASS